LHEIKVEDTVILIDASRSMFKKDFEPNRLSIALQVAENFIKTKFIIDSKDKILLLSFGKIVRKLSPFSYDEDFLIKSLKKIQISGKGNVYEGIAFSLQLLIEEMRKIGGIITRIFLISDNKININFNNKLQKLIKVAKGLGVFIDVCQIGKSDDVKKVTLKRMTQLTSGEFGYFNNSKALINAGKSFASKKSRQKTSDYFSPNQKSKLPPLISEVAISLRRPTVLEIRLMMSGRDKGQEKCQICHSIKAPMTGADFFSEGRYCPSCDRPMHLSCAALWAKKTEYNDNVFRCPFCYFLLKLPKSVLKLMDITSTSSNQKIKILDVVDVNQTKMEEIPEDNIAQINASCSYCHGIFLGETKVYRCEKCGSYYHEPCLEKMYGEIKACRFCGTKISFA